MGAKTLLSLDEFMALPDDGNRHELNQGELIVMPPPKSVHPRVVERIFLTLAVYVRERGIGAVYTEAGYVLARDPEPTIRQPDLSFLSAERVHATPLDEYFAGAPDLAVEVVSPTDSAAELEVKVAQYLAYGSKEVWVFYPKTRSIQVHKPGGQVVKLSETDTLTSSLFPGFSARVADFFDLDY